MARKALDEMLDELGIELGDLEPELLALAVRDAMYRDREQSMKFAIGGEVWLVPLRDWSEAIPHVVREILDRHIEQRGVVAQAADLRARGGSLIGVVPGLDIAVEHSDVSDLLEGLREEVFTRASDLAFEKLGVLASDFPLYVQWAFTEDESDHVEDIFESLRSI